MLTLGLPPDRPNRFELRHHRLGKREKNGRLRDRQRRKMCLSAQAENFIVNYFKFERSGNLE